MKTCLKEIRQFICFNQKELIKYEYLVAEKHRLLRLCLEEKPVDAQKVEDLIDDLINVAYINLLEILKENVSYINKVLESIGIEVSPKITIKTLEDGNVLDFFRSDTLASLDTSKIEDNTGFFEIMNDPNKMNFIRHDLENDFLNNKYSNSRLKNELREKLKNGEVSWRECWQPIGEGQETFDYRSTLIIPMSIRITENDPESFVKQFSKKVSQSEGVRTVWGFLCFDSPEKNAFKKSEEELKDVGYIAADILSLYLMFFYNHISGSRTFNKALKYLK